MFETSGSCKCSWVQSGVLKRPRLIPNNCWYKNLLEVEFKVGYLSSIGCLSKLCSLRNLCSLSMLCLMQSMLSLSFFVLIRLNRSASINPPQPILLNWSASIEPPQSIPLNRSSSIDPPQLPREKISIL